MSCEEPVLDISEKPGILQIFLQAGAVVIVYISYPVAKLKWGFGPTKVL